MKLQSFGISNFKAFGKEFQTIPIKPITLVFGPNSAGKSSLLHSLLWLNHAANLGETDVFHPVLARKAVNLGGFDRCLNRKSGKHRLKLSITMENEVSEVESTEWRLHAPTFRMDLFYARIQRGTTPTLEKCDLYADGKILLRSKFWNVDNPWIEAKVEWSHPALKGMLPQDQIEEHATFAEYRLDCRGMMPRRIELDGLGGWILEGQKNSLGDLYSLFAKKFPDQIAEIFGCFSSVISEMQYLPPLREIPDSSVDLRNCDLPGWRWLAKHPESFCDNINGKLEKLKIEHQVKVRPLIPADTVKECVIRTLAQAEAGSDPESLSDSAENAKCIWASFSYTDRRQWLDRHPALFKQMVDYCYDYISSNDLFLYYEKHPEADKDKPVPSWWIKERAEDLALSFIDDWGSVTATVAFGNEAARLFISEDQGVRDAIMNALKERGLDKDLLPGDGHLQLRLHDPKRDVWVALQDVGVGTSQVLPIILESLAQTNKLIAIEQPELHLHPALQAELGDVFIESALGGNKNTFLLETHSEHLILRILRRIRETTEKDFSDWSDELKKACPDGIRPEDVAVLYVQQGENGSEVIEMPVTPDGDFARPWPGGFFAERDNELF
jgi:hypothetical protein